MTYSGPDGTDIPNPTLDFLGNIIFRERNRYWRGGSGDWMLSVVEFKGEKIVTLLQDQPALAFWLVERHGFFFTYFQRRRKSVEQFVPFAGGESKPWVKHFAGGVETYVPRA